MMRKAYVHHGVDDSDKVLSHHNCIVGMDYADTRSKLRLLQTRNLNLTYVESRRIVSGYQQKKRAIREETNQTGVGGG